MLNKLASWDDDEKNSALRQWFVGTTCTRTAGMQLSGNSYLATESLGTVRTPSLWQWWDRVLPYWVHAVSGTIHCQVIASRRCSRDLPQGGSEIPCPVTFQGGAEGLAVSHKSSPWNISRDPSWSLNEVWSSSCAHVVTPTSEVVLAIEVNSQSKTNPQKLRKLCTSKIWRCMVTKTAWCQPLSHSVDIGSNP